MGCLIKLNQGKKSITVSLAFKKIKYVINRGHLYNRDFDQNRESKLLITKCDEERKDKR